MSEKAQKMTKRITELDLLRGIAVLLMIFDHVMFDMWGLFPTVFYNYPPFEGFWHKVYGFSIFYWNWNVRITVRYFIVFIFLALTGICCSFSKSNLKRGVKLGAVALLMTLATYVVGQVIGDVDITIVFGVLHCIALTLIIIGVLEKLGTNKWVYLAVGVFMIVLGWYFERGQVYYSFKRMEFFELFWRTVTGSAACGGDSFSLFFNGGQIFVGVFLGKLLYREKKSLVFKKYHASPITFIGRHSLIVYVLHQALIPVVIGGVMLACGFSFGM